jgi:hypothetical protein
LFDARYRAAMRTALWLLVSLHFALSLACNLSAQSQGPGPLTGSRPNIVFVFSDDHAAHAISAYGSRLCKTPNIDRIAHDGVRFANNFCGNALCGPSRATVLTGLLLLPVAGHALWQMKAWDPSSPESSLRIFRSNTAFGLLVLLMFAL